MPWLQKDSTSKGNKIELKGAKAHESWLICG